MAYLTASKVKSTPFDTKPYKITDGKGLYLYVGRSFKSWRYDYRFQGKRKTLSLGEYPEISLSRARSLHFDARRDLAEGIDPAHQKQIKKQEQLGIYEDSFQHLAQEWYDRQLTRWTHGHSRTIKSRLEQNVFPWIGDMRIQQVTTRDILEICRRIEDRNAFETAHRVKSICSQIFRYCIALDLCDSDPCRDLKNALTPSRPRHMPAITEPQEVGGLMRAIQGYRGNSVTRLGLQLAPLVFVRPGELRHAEWKEFDFEQKLWKIPGEKMKMRQVHLVPLSKQALKILDDLNTLTGKGKYLFPSVRTTDRPMSDNTLLSALRRLGFDRDEMTVHGFRAMASTLLHEQGWSTEFIEKQLAHNDRNSVRAAYNHAEYLRDRIEMMQFWADHLEELRRSN